MLVGHGAGMASVAQRRETEARALFQPIKGVRVLEIAQFAYVPSAKAMLADGGADIVKMDKRGEK
jgi:crotonobetainyl-CoA:carnitine CoA-transferase CaiB-like acyl-CoA transferase